MKNLNLKKLNGEFMKSTRTSQLFLAGAFQFVSSLSFAQNLASEYTLQTPAATVRAGQVEVVEFADGFRNSGTFCAKNFSKEALEEILKSRPNLVVSKGGERECGKNPRSKETWNAEFIFEQKKDRWGTCLTARYGFKVENQEMRMFFPNSVRYEGAPISSRSSLSAPVVQSIRLSELSQDGNALILETSINLNGWEKVLNYGSSVLQVRQAYVPRDSCRGFSVRSAGGLVEAVSLLRSADLANMHYCEFGQTGDAMSTEYEYDRSLRSGIKTLVMRRDGAIQAYSSDRDVKGAFFLRPNFQNDPAKVLAARKAADEYTKLVGAYADQILLVGGSSLAEIRQVQKAWLQKNSGALVSALEEVEDNLESISGFEKAIVLMNLRHANKVAEEVERTFAKQLALDEVVGR